MLFTFGCVPALTRVLRVVMCQEGRAEVEGVLAVFGPDPVDTLIEPAIILDSEGLTKEIRLWIGVGELREGDHGSAVEGAGLKEVLEGWPGDVEEFVGEIGRARECKLGRVMLEGLGPQEDIDPPRLESILPRAHAGGLDIFGELSKDKAWII